VLTEAARLQGEFDVFDVIQVKESTATIAERSFIDDEKRSEGASVDAFCRFYSHNTFTVYA